MTIWFCCQDGDGHNFHGYSLYRCCTVDYLICSIYIICMINYKGLTNGQDLSIDNIDDIYKVINFISQGIHRYNKRF